MLTLSSHLISTRPRQRMAEVSLGESPAPSRNLAQEFRRAQEKENRRPEEAQEVRRGQEKENRRPEEQEGLAKVVRQLEGMNSKLATLTQTVLLMEKRLGLVEEQVRLLSHK